MATTFCVVVSAAWVRYCVATTVALMPRITAIHRPPLPYPDGSTCQAFAYIRPSARDKLVALISTINPLMTPNVVDCWASRGNDWSRVVRVLPDGCKVSVTWSPTLVPPSPANAARAISSGIILT